MVGLGKKKEAQVYKDCSKGVIKKKNKVKMNKARTDNKHLGKCIGRGK